MNISRLPIVLAASAVIASGLIGCGSSSNSTPPAPPPATAVTIKGSIMDGSVAGGSLYVFDAAGVQAALAAADTAADRPAALTGASPLAQLTRAPDSDDLYTLELNASHAGKTLFVIFDATGAADRVFGDEPFNLESLMVAGASGSSTQVNLNPHTTLATRQVLSRLDPDGDGQPIAATAIADELTAATINVMSVFGQDTAGTTYFSDGDNPFASTDRAALIASSTAVGAAVREFAAGSAESMNSVVHLIAADTADGVLDGSSPSVFPLSPEDMARLQALALSAVIGRSRPGDVETVTCTGSAVQLRRACEFEAQDEHLLEVAGCADTDDEDEFRTCSAESLLARGEVIQECQEIHEARLELCEALDDLPHSPEFGGDFADRFVDPRDIGDSVEPNPYLPLVPGNFWLLEAEFEEDGEPVTETITVTVTGRTKLIDGVRCVVVRDIVEVDEELVEDTDDWFAQDLDGNVWYCGEEAKDYEITEGDMPPEPELVAIDGSFKHGREGDKAGVLLPAAPVVGAVMRQEMSVANAEDAIEILSLAGTESAPAASCDGDCLVTRDFTPFDPGALENKYYAPGVGLIVEVDVNSGDRAQLIEYGNEPL